MFAGFLCRDVKDDLIVLVKGIQLHSGQVEKKKREKKRGLDRQGLILRRGALEPRVLTTWLFDTHCCYHEMEA